MVFQIHKPILGKRRYQLFCYSCQLIPWNLRRIGYRQTIAAKVDNRRIFTRHNPYEFVFIQPPRFGKSWYRLKLINWSSFAMITHDIRIMSTMIDLSFLYRIIYLDYTGVYIKQMQHLCGVASMIVSSEKSLSPQGKARGWQSSQGDTIMLATPFEFVLLYRTTSYHAVLWYPPPPLP